TEVEYFSKVVTTAEIEAQKFNLSVSTYVEKEDTSVEIDIDELNQRISQIVARQNVLRTEIDELVKTL
ncbi:MAG: type I restriction-modification system subunit M, partial [Bacteroidales bacterium]|nr:type I restriction-modification system subunit M [Bacteroidales bacterium]